LGASPNSVKSDELRGPVILLGLGYTTSRLARRLLIRGLPVFAVVRQPDRFADLRAVGLRITRFDLPESGAELPKSAVLVHTIPPLPEPEAAALRFFIQSLKPRRVVYISATTVYGDQTDVTAETAARPCGEKSRRRVEEENWIAAGPWPSLIVRPAAIYGPGRGVHVRVREGRVPRGEGLVSRIHVEDLAAVLEAGVLSDLTGAWPLADDRACAGEEIKAWCARLLALPSPAGAAPFRVAGRKVDGSKIRELLGVRLAFPDYQAGILASLALE
jgi:nucleoside-diphosphate-sugar epimerase